MRVKGYIVEIFLLVILAIAFISVKLWQNRDELYTENQVGERYMVTRVFDGDTLLLERDGSEEKLRLIGVDTPEIGECYYEESSNYLEDLVQDLAVEVELDDSQGERDRFDRLLGYLWVDGKLVNNEMVRLGFGYEYTYADEYRHRDLFVQSEKSARDSSLGLWAACENQ